MQKALPLVLFSALLLTVMTQGKALPETRFTYFPFLDGIDDKALNEQIRESTDTFKLAYTDKIGSLSLLKKTMESDIPIIQRIMRSRGYYDSSVKIEITELDGDYKATIIVNSGPVYIISSIEVHVEGHPELETNSVLKLLYEYGMRIGYPCLTETVLNSERKLINELKNIGYPFPELKDRQYIVDHTKRTMEIRYELDPGPKLYFGNLIVHGLSSTREEYIKNLVPWHNYEPFSKNKLELFRAKLYETNLFSTVSVTTGNKTSEDNTIDIVTEVTERKHRSIGGGLSYRSYEGAGLKLGWEDRNLLGRGEGLEIKGELLSKLSYQQMAFKKPYFLGRPQSFHLIFENRDESQEGYDASTISGKAFVNIPKWKGISVSFGVSGKQGSITDLFHEYTYSMISLPLNLGKEKVDDLVNPTKGFKSFLNLSPSYILQDGQEFLKANWGGSTYLPISRENGLTIAFKANLGLITNPSRNNVPADERFYAGGDQSVRGYAYQTIGQLMDTKPLGGKGLLELGSELRKRWAENVGFALFLEGGSVYKSYPLDSSSSLRWGTGIGLRYFTPLGPIRFDIATPLNRRDGIDRLFAVYFNVGHTF